jgi:hypothetical protein
MGEIAELILAGVLCQHCGGHIGDAVGYPRTCKECGQDGGDTGEPPLKRRYRPTRSREGRRRKK